MDIELNKLNIYDYFISADIAAYCRDIGKIFTPLEMAIIINNSYASIKKKHEAYRILISDYEDMQLDSPQFTFPGIKVSLHHALAHIIEEEQGRIRDFISNDSYAVFQAAVIEGTIESEEGLFSNFQNAIETLRDRYFGKDDGIMRKFMVYKYFIDYDEYHEYCAYYVDLNGEILLEQSFEIDEGTNLWLGFLSDFTLEIPVPFSRGDIIEYIGTNGPKIFVFDCFTSNKSALSKEYRSLGVDNVGTWAQAFSVSRSRISIALIDYTKIKYYRGKVPKDELLLKYLSDYLHERIGLADFFHSLNKQNQKHIL